MSSITLVWFRNDLRLADNPALQAAVARGNLVMPVFIWSPEEEAPWQPGGASRWWLHQSLRALDDKLRQAGSRLILRRGPALETLLALIRETGAGSVYWNRRYEPALLERDSRIREALLNAGIPTETLNAALLCEPWTIKNQSGGPFRVFTPFWKRCLAQGEPPSPLPEPSGLPAPLKWPESLSLDALELEPKVGWTDGMRSMWQPGEAGAQFQLARFLSQAAGEYDTGRDRPDLPGTSRLSPHLHFGEIGPRQLWRALRDRAAKPMTVVDGQKKVSSPTVAALERGAWLERYCAELGWREFAHHLLYHFPRTPEEPLRGEFLKLPWRSNEVWRQAWQRGQTGYPLVDAGLRELWSCGWMHNRVRMVAASFLVKHLQISWTEGARWFWDTLVDADLAANTLGWQWTAGCGADAAPYFRIFNPVAQGQKFDPNGDYVRLWIPELGRLPAQWIHQPWKAPQNILDAAGVRLGTTYPLPIVSHLIAREVALEAYAAMRKE